MITKIDHLVITTSNIDQCLNFYKLLGFNVVKGHGRYELFARNFKINVHILHHELLPKATHVQVGSADLCFEIDSSLEDFKQDLIQKGISIEEGIVDRTGVKGFMRSIYIRDYDGNLLEFCSYN